MNTLSVFLFILLSIPKATEESDSTILFAFFIFLEVVIIPDNGPTMSKPSPSNLIYAS